MEMFNTLSALFFFFKIFFYTKQFSLSISKLVDHRRGHCLAQYVGVRNCPAPADYDHDQEELGK